jgi:hypothetical protein
MYSQYPTTSFRSLRNCCASSGLWRLPQKIVYFVSQGLAHDKLERVTLRQFSQVHAFQKPSFLVGPHLTQRRAKTRPNNGLVGQSLLSWSAAGNARMKTYIRHRVIIPLLRGVPAGRGVSHARRNTPLNPLSRGDLVVGVAPNILSPPSEIYEIAI